MRKRWLCYVLTLCLVLVLLPATPTFADENSKSDIIQIALEDYKSAVLKSDGTLWTWTWNVHSRLSSMLNYGTNNDSITPTKFLDNVKSVSLGWDSSAVIKSDGTLWIWGNNYYGQIGDGTNEDKPEPVKIMDNVSSVCLGMNYSAAIKTDGTLWTWGNNTSGQLGNGTYKDQNVPAKIMDDVAFVSLGWYHSAAIKKDGTLWTWGSNEKGQLGNGASKGSNVPIMVMDHVSTISLGGYHSSALKTDGTLWTWGSNDHGQVGDGTTEDRNLPVNILDDVSSVSLGYYHSAALKKDGSLWTWAINESDEVTTGSLVPVKLMDNVTSICLGGFNSAAVRTDGSFWKWQAFPSQDGTYGYSIKFLETAKYVPYWYQISLDQNKKEVYSLSTGKLPDGLSISEDGVLSGIPKELGVFVFSVADQSGNQYTFNFSVIWQGGTDVETYNEKGYGFVETAADNGRVHDQFVTSVEELKPQTMHCEASFTEFYALYLDAQKLTRGADYTASEGSTRLTLTDKTLANAGSGTHVLAAEFHTRSSSGALAIKYTTQKYTVTGIPGKNVNVVVKGVPVIWTDAEPYVNKDSRTMVPFRAIADALGLTVDWNSSTREAIFSNGSKTIYFPLDSKTARTSAGGSVSMDTAAISVNGRSYAPVRYLAEFFGYTVTWDGKTRTVGIS